MKRVIYSLVAVTVIITALGGLNSSRAVAAADDDDPVALIAGIRSQPAGQTYGRWAVEWWQWVLGVPAAVSPLLDTTGQHCARRQVGEVWFLAGSNSSAPVVRACAIPAGKSLFFPLVNTVYGAFLNEPPKDRTEAVVRTFGSCTIPAQIQVSIDGIRVSNPLRFSTSATGSQSPFFNVQLPPGHLFEPSGAQIDELVLSPSAEQGYYLFVRPLSPGPHTIRWTASGCLEVSPGVPFSQDITYDLTIGG